MTASKDPTMPKSSESAVENRRRQMKDILNWPPNVLRRFWENVEVGDGPECWRWLGTITTTGYGQMNFHRVSLYAHRVSYTLKHGEIPSSLVIDHLCRNRRCVNPAHLDLVTSKTNILRGTGAPAINAAMSTCRNGHPFDFIDHNGRRACRRCRMAYFRTWRSRRLALKPREKGE